MVGVKRLVHWWFLGGKDPTRNERMGRSPRSLQMNRLSLRNNWLEVQDFKKINDFFSRGIYGVYLI